MFARNGFLSELIVQVFVQSMIIGLLFLWNTKLGNLRDIYKPVVNR